MNLQLLYDISAVIGLIACGVLFVFLLVNLFRQVTGRAVLMATGVTLGFVVSHSYFGYHRVTLCLELLSLLAWNLMLARILGIGWRSQATGDLALVRRLFIAVGLGTFAVIAYLTTIDAAAYASPNNQLLTAHVFILLLYTMSLVMLEQVARNAREDHHWRSRYHNIAMATLFSYGVLIHACAAMFLAPVPALMLLHPTIIAIVCPLIAVAALRNRNNPLRINLSRGFVFRSGVGCGRYGAVDAGRTGLLPAPARRRLGPGHHGPSRHPVCGRHSHLIGIE